MPLLSLPKRLRPSTEPIAEPIAEDAPRSSRSAEIVALLTLSRRTASRFSPPVSVLIAWLWSVAGVALGTFVVALLLTAQWGSTDWSLVTLWVGGWRISHLMPINTSSGLVSLVPMLPGLAVAGILIRASGWLWASLRSHGSAFAASGLAGLATAYFVFAAFVAASPSPQTPNEAPATAGWAALFMLVAASVGWAWLRAAGSASNHLSWLVARAIRIVLLAVGALAALVLTLQLIRNFAEFNAVTNNLLNSGPEPAGAADALWLLLLQLAYLPNLLVWVASYLTGVGFAVGESTVVSPFTVDYGGLPNLPVATLLPSTGLSWAILPPLMVASAAILGGVIVRRAGYGWRLRSRILLAILLAFLTGAAAYFLAAASSGSLGDGRLSLVGPTPSAMALSVVAVTGLGYLTWAIFPSLVADLRPYAGQVGRKVTRGR